MCSEQSPSNVKKINFLICVPVIGNVFSSAVETYTYKLFNKTPNKQINIIKLLSKYLHVVSLNSDTGGSSQHLQMPQQRVRSEQHTADAIAARFAVIVSTAAAVSAAAKGLDDHLVNAAGGRTEGFLHILEFGVQSAPRLHPQFLYPVLEIYRN
jgi:hypothetical protein